MHEPHLERVSSLVEQTIADEREEGLRLERIRSPERAPSHAPRPSRDSASLVNADIEQEAAIPRCEHDDPKLNGSDGSLAPIADDTEQKNSLADGKDQAADEKPDPNLVSWDSPDSPENPRNWTFGRRYIVAMTVAMYTFLSPIASSAIAPALPNIAHDLNVTGSTETNLLLSLFVLAFAFRPLMWSPLSETYGRRIVLQSTNIFFLVFNMSCGFANTQAQYCVLRFLSGLAGSAPLSIGGGSISDMFEPQDRGQALSWYSLAPMLAPCVGPIISSWMVTKDVSWRWIHWMWSAFGLLIAVAGFFALPETYQPRILKVKRDRLARETGNDALYTAFTATAMSPRKRLSKALVRPIVMLTTEIILVLIAMAMLLVYGLLYLMLTTFTVVFRESYHESVGIARLNYVSLALGFSLGGQIGGRLLDKIYVYLSARNGGKGTPEYKLPLSLAGGLALVFGLIIYGWGAEKQVHWIVPNIGACLFAFGGMLCFMSFMNYIIDSYGVFAASGVAGAVFIRSLAGFGFPLFAGQLYAKLNYGWGNTTLALIYLVIGIPSSCLFLRYGPYLRSKSPHQSGRKSL